LIRCSARTARFAASSTGGTYIDDLRAAAPQVVSSSDLRCREPFAVVMGDGPEKEEKSMLEGMDEEAGAAAEADGSSSGWDDN
jgi:hypothetical protein